jgi:N-acetylglucosaminyldiphosphoundecaprenol N-acetyl-beta-D-mannosaminyltransferase
MLNSSTPSEYAESITGSASSEAVHGYLTPTDLSVRARRPTSAEIAAAITAAPGMASTDSAAMVRDGSLKNPRVERTISAPRATAVRRRPRPLALVPSLSRPFSVARKAPARVPLMGVRLDCVTEAQVTSHVMSSIRAGVGGWIATPNVDHLRIISERPDLRRIVNEADFRVADGMPLVWASRLQGTPLPERVTGAGLTLSLAAAAAKAGVSIFLLGGDPGDAEAAAIVLRLLNPNLKIAGIMCPPPAFEQDPLQMVEIGNALHSAKPDLVYSCFGFPKQELVIRALRERLPSAWFLGLGGSLAIVSGRTRRAPRWMQNIGMEWAWRLGMEPRRLFHRYVVKDLPFVVRLLGNAIVQH